MVTLRNTILFGRILTRTNATCGSNLWRRSLNTLTRPFITTVVMNHEPYRSWRNDAIPMRKMSQSVWSMSIDTFTGTSTFQCGRTDCKDIGNFIGAQWTSPQASGLQSLVWRHHWEHTQDA